MNFYASDKQVFLFGNGLIGHSANAAIAASLSAPREDVAYDWSDAQARERTRAALTNRLRKDTPVALVWTAGITGFGSSTEDSNAELAQLEEVANWAGSLQQAGHAVTFHLTSSAGGLFEGQSHVTDQSVPAPQRPYGTGKLQQESVLRTVADRTGMTARIYRPSSVYGYVPGRRMGLITVVIRNTLLGEPIMLTGSTETLRDYVLADDIGRHLARQVMAKGDAPLMNLLASGQAVTIGDILARVERVLGMAPDVQKAASQDNAAHMSFAPEALPADWVSTPLDEGIAACATKIEAELKRTGLITA